MRSRKARLAGALAAGVIYPLADLGVACMQPISEACVWGKAFLPVTFALSLSLLSPFVFLVLTVVGSIRTRRLQERAGRTDGESGH